MRTFAEQGLLRLVVPPSYGGTGAGPGEFLAFVESVARVHASTAWTVMTCNEEAGIASAYLQPEPMRHLFAERPDVIIAGSGVPKGRAFRVDGGWRVSGTWDFVSGCTAADELVLGALVVDENEEIIKPAEICFVLVPVAETEIVDTWHTAGLAGTGSNDVILTGHVVEDNRCGVVAVGGLPRPTEPFYRLPSGLRFPFPKVGIALGVAHAAVEAFDALAGAKKPLYARSSLAHRPTAASARARAEALIGSSRAWVLSLADELMAAVSDESVRPELHARCRLACSHAVRAANEAIALLLDEAGSTANRVDSPLPRLAADARAVSGHFMVAPYQMATAGQVLLGLEATDPQF